MLQALLGIVGRAKGAAASSRVALVTNIRLVQDSSRPGRDRSCLWSVCGHRCGLLVSRNQTTECASNRDEAKAWSNGAAESDCSLYAVQPGPEQALFSSARLGICTYWYKAARFCSQFPVESHSDLAFCKPRRSLRGEARGGRPDILVEVCPSAPAKRKNSHSG